MVPAFITFSSFSQPVPKDSLGVPYDWLTEKEKKFRFAFRWFCMISWHHPKVDGCYTTALLTGGPRTMERGYPANRQNFPAVYLVINICLEGERAWWGTIQFKGSD